MLQTSVHKVTPHTPARDTCHPVAHMCKGGAQCVYVSGSERHVSLQYALVVSLARRGVTPCGLSPRGPWAGSMLQLGTLHTAYTPGTPTHSDSTVILELHTLAKAPLTPAAGQAGHGRARSPAHCVLSVTPHSNLQHTHCITSSWLCRCGPAADPSAAAAAATVSASGMAAANIYWYLVGTYPFLSHTTTVPRTFLRHLPALTLWQLGGTPLPRDITTVPRILARLTVLQAYIPKRS